MQCHHDPTGQAMITARNVLCDSIHALSLDQGPHVRLLRPYIDVAYVYHSHPSQTCYISL